MSITVLVGTHWGDEGKAKVVDHYSENADVVVRFQGGANAGHTVVVGDQKWIFHQIPVGLLHPDKSAIVGNGVVFDPAAFLGELDELTERGLSYDGRLFISDRAHVVMPYHRAIEAIREKALGKSAIGTTLRGIGPAYLDKIARDTGIRVGDLVRPELFEKRLRETLAVKNELLTRAYDAEPLDGDAILAEHAEYGRRLAPYVTDTSELLFNMQKDGKKIVYEGAQGTLLDVDHGTYPFVTSSNTSAGGACTGTGVGPTAITEVIGITKAYTSRVGNGPMPTEFEGEFGDRMRDLWEEYGATTKRPRRCGWQDGAILRYSARINGLTGIALTALDRLDTLPEISLCTGYTLDGKPINTIPAATGDFERVVPIMETMPGWLTSTTEVRKCSDLPQAALDYIRRIEEIAGVPVRLVGVGPGRDQMIVACD
jgi:adenylosuccinate synthase